MWFFKKKEKIVKVPVPYEYFFKKGWVHLYDSSKKGKYACLNLTKEILYIKGAHAKTMNVSVMSKNDKNDNLYITGRLSNGDNYYISITRCLTRYNKADKTLRRFPIYKCEINVTINPDKMDLHPYPPHVLYVFP